MSIAFTRTLRSASAAPRSRYSTAFASSAFSPSPSTPSRRVWTSSSPNFGSRHRASAAGAASRAVAQAAAPVARIGDSCARAVAVGIAVSAANPGDSSHQPDDATLHRRGASPKLRGLQPRRFSFRPRTSVIARAHSITDENRDRRRRAALDGLLRILEAAGLESSSAVRTEALFLYHLLLHEVVRGRSSPLLLGDLPPAAVAGHAGVCERPRSVLLASIEERRRTDIYRVLGCAAASEEVIKLRWHEVARCCIPTSAAIPRTSAR
jgi:hypothetical protein